MATPNIEQAATKGTFMRATSLRRWVLRPSLWTCLVSIVAYWDGEAIRGSYVYDDAGSIKNNVVVKGDVPWTEAFTRDFWGTPMIERQSHKSFRPITTLSFRLNWIVSEKLGTNGTDQHTIGFHLVNLGLHGLVTGLVTESASFVFDTRTDIDILSQTLTGMIFALHPIHAEAVSNITSRGELLMSLFYLLAFLSYATHVPLLEGDHSFRAKLRGRFYVYVVPWICMTISLFCKEQGASALITLVAWDFIRHHSSIFRDFLPQLLQHNQRAVAFTQRAIILAIQTLIVVAIRYWLNGDTSPDFIFDQNPAAFSKDRFTRWSSINLVYCLYIWDILYPRCLSPDWSGKGIDLIQSCSDPRIVYIVLLWIGLVASFGSLAAGISDSASPSVRKMRRIILLAIYAFILAPFLLSSNFLVVVGLMKADRVMYLPLTGFCLLEALLIQSIFLQRDNPDTSKIVPRSRSILLGYYSILLQLFLFAAKVHERNIAWSNSLALWRAAYEINPRSHHTLYNCGYELSLKRRFTEAEYVLRPIADPRVDGPSNTFVYAMVLFNLDRCGESRILVEEALQVVEEKRREGGVRNSEEKLRRAKSNLLVAKAYCTPDTPTAGKLLYDAVQTDPTNGYAIEQATEMVKKVQAMQEMMEHRSKLGLTMQ